jgi:hypothetical protein
MSFPDSDKNMLAVPGNALWVTLPSKAALLLALSWTCRSLLVCFCSKESQEVPVVEYSKVPAIHPKCCY